MHLSVRTRSVARELADNGVILQLNKGSFFREFGERSYHAGPVDPSPRGLAGVIASDAHDPVMRTTDLAEMKETAGDGIRAGYGGTAARKAAGSDSAGESDGESAGLRRFNKLAFT